MYSEKRPWEYDLCKCGNKKQKRNVQCKRCSNIMKNNERFGEFDRRKCPKCCGEKKRQADCCLKCKKDERWTSIMEKSLNETMYHNSASRAVYNSVRKYAREHLIREGVRKECVVCGYDICLDVSHFKPIMEFGKDEKLKVVNSLSNIMYLCPNHHKEFDKKKISEDDKKKIEDYLRNCL